MDFPILDLMDPDACYQFLVRTPHPDGLGCPRCDRAGGHATHDRHRPPVFDYRCRGCGAVDPPRRRANKRRGHGPFANDRPPVAGVVRRQTGEIVRRVVERAGGTTPTAVVTDHTADGALVYTDEWGGYERLPAAHRGHPTVNHTPGPREWARDDDGDGIRDVHDNTLEGLWAASRTFPRPFRGIGKQ